MPNGKLHDHPISDLLIHGKHPFPMDIEQLILQLKDLSPDYSSPGILDELGHAPFDWEKGKNLDEARDLLRALVQSHDDLAAIRRLVQEYEAKTGKGGS